MVKYCKERNVLSLFSVKGFFIMADTLPDVRLSWDGYTDLYAATGIPTGTELHIQNKSGTDIYVQATAMSSASTVAGVRQATVNNFNAGDKTLTGAVFANTLIVSILLSGVNSLSLSPSVPVRIRVEGVSNT